MRRRHTTLVQTALLFLAALFLLLGFRHFGFGGPFAQGRVSLSTDEWSIPAEQLNEKEKADESNQASRDPSNPARPDSYSSPGLKDGNPTLLRIAPSYVKAILTPEDNSFSRLDCPVPSRNRYDYLRNSPTTPLDSGTGKKYFFALALHQCAHLLPRLFGSIVESMRFLGPENCVLSVVEGRSDDGTFEVLKTLREEVERIGATYFLSTNDVDPLASNVYRIDALSELRNQALRPLLDHPKQSSSKTTVVFLNDVAVCMEDILELIHQRIYQNADMTCAMDWTYVAPDPTFYDVWIARGMNGDTFFNIPENGSWGNAWNLFWNNPNAKERLDAGIPFQVFSCWNGATAFTARPLLEHKVKFRSAYEHECPAGEPKLFCKDMWHHGYGKIAVVPSVNLEYSDEAGKKIKSAKSYVFEKVETEAEWSVPLQIQWQASPPPEVKCMPTYSTQSWMPWNNGLVGPDPVS